MKPFKSKIELPSPTQPREEVVGGSPLKKTRRAIIGSTLGAAGAGLLPRGLWADGDPVPGKSAAVRVPMRPHLLITAEKVEGLRSVQELRESVKTGHGRLLWQDLKALADEDLKAAPLAGAYRSFPPVNATVQRVLRHALAFLITEQETYRDAALAQIEATFDPKLWKNWLDQAAPKNWTTGLRVGMLCSAFGLAYDWLYTSLTPEQRQRVVDGVDRCGIQGYLQAVEAGSWIVGVLDNFCSIIVGGTAIAGMAFGDDHPQSGRLIELGKERVGAYLGEFGPEGEWAESVGYSASVIDLTMFFSTLRYWSAPRAGGAKESIIGTRPLPQFCQWLMYMTRPHGREALLGNVPKAVEQRRISLSYVPAVAAATSDGILQGYYLNNLFSSQETNGVRNHALELVWYDQTLLPASPEGQMPHGKVFPAHTGCVSSRTDWNPRVTPCMVYGKGGKAYETNGHHDVGQVCIDGYGEPLIVDLGGYGDQQSGGKILGGAAGHNVLTFDGEDMRYDRPLSRAMFNTPERRKTPPLRAKFLGHEFDDKRGGYWVLDTTEVYGGVQEVMRTVVHLNPGIVVVLDRAALPQPREVSLRWHTTDKCEPKSDGKFVVQGAGGVQLASRVVRVNDGELSVAKRTHNETGDGFIEASLRGQQCALVSLFCVFAPGTRPGSWEGSDGGWSIGGPAGVVDVKVSSTALSVAYRDGRTGWRVQESK